MNLVLEIYLYKSKGTTKFCHSDENDAWRIYDGKMISQRAAVDSRHEEHYGISGNNVGSGFLSCRQKLATVTKPGSVSEPS